MKKEFKPIDLKEVKTYPLAERKSKVGTADFAKTWQKGSDLQSFLDSLPGILAGSDIKSVISAIAAAYRNKKTVILELDLRKPKLTELLLNEQPTTGITNYLVGEKEIRDIIRPVEEYDDLYLISSGPAPPNPAELIMNKRMDELLEYQKEHYDYIVMDTPPTSLVADAYLLNRFATSSIFVVRAGKTKKGDILKDFET